MTFIFILTKSHKINYVAREFGVQQLPLLLSHNSSNEIHSQRFAPELRIIFAKNCLNVEIALKSPFLSYDIIK